MAGLFDFKSAEQILQERRAATKANQQQLLSTIVSAAPKESRQASMLGAQLGIALGNILGKSEKEQLQEFRDMGETTQAMEKAGVGGEGSSYGAGVLQQAQAEEQRRMGLLPEEMQQSERLRIGMERVPEDLDLVSKYKYLAKVFQDAGLTSSAAQVALLAGQEAQRQRELQDKLDFEREQKNEITPYQQEQLNLAKQRLASERVQAVGKAEQEATEREQDLNIKLSGETRDLEEGAAGLIAVKRLFQDVESGKVSIDDLDLPGIGTIDRFFALDNKARENKGIVQGLINVILRARSGGAVSESEADRLEEEAQGLRSEKDVYQFYKRLEEQINTRLDKVVGAYPKDIQENYWNRTKPKNSLPPSGDNGEDANPDDITWEGL